MAQHLLLGDLGPLVLACAATAARAFHPVIALVAWATNLIVWHVPAVYEAALHHEAVHAGQHVALFAAGCLFWSAVLCARRSVPARLAALAGMMVVSLGLSTVFLWWPHVLYSTYRHAHTLGGISPLSDQRAGGGLMLLEGSAVAFAVAAWLILQLLREDAVSPAAGDVSPLP
jgi:putative membrane protein